MRTVSKADLRPILWLFAGYTILLAIIFALMSDLFGVGIGSSLILLGLMASFGAASSFCKRFHRFPDKAEVTKLVLGSTVISALLSIPVAILLMFGMEAGLPEFSIAAWLFLFAAGLVVQVLACWLGYGPMLRWAMRYQINRLDA